MPQIEKINAKLTAFAKEQMLNFLSQTNIEGAMIGIDKGRWEDESEEHWGYGSYSPEQIEKVAPEYEEQGHSLLYDLDGITIVFSQVQLLEELEGKTIDINKGRLLIKDNE
jgi:hypothetical protein